MVKNTAHIASKLCLISTALPHHAHQDSAFLKRLLVLILPKFCIISAKSKGKPCKQAPKSQALKSSGLFLS